MTYTPPADLDEFIERHPHHIRSFLSRTFHLRGADLDDAVQNVYLHLLSLPDGSIHAHRGDRVATYKGGDINSRAHFLWYINLVVKRYMWNQSNSAARRIAAKSISVEEMTGNNDGEIKELQCAYDGDVGLRVRQILNIAHKIDPIVAKAGIALGAFGMKTEAASSIGISVGQLDHCIELLRKIDAGDAEALNPRRRPRGMYQPRKKRAAA